MRKLVFVVLAAMLGVAPAVFAQEAAAQNNEKPASASAEAENPAIAFLQKAEKKNEETKSLTASFTQTRIDNIFGDEVKSQGRFWYLAPGKFRASYESENSSEIWMVDGKMISYVPNIDQVDIVNLEEGEDAPIHQMLLGFGTRVDKIQEIFEVAPAEKEKEGLVGIDFTSKDKARSLEYELITIYFNEEKVEPRQIVAEADDSTIVVDLKEIKFNPPIDMNVFKPTWPKDVDVITHGTN